MKKIIIPIAIIIIFIGMLCFIFIPKYLNSGNEKEEVVNNNTNNDMETNIEENSKIEIVKENAETENKNQTGEINNDVKKENAPINENKIENNYQQGTFNNEGKVEEESKEEIVKSAWEKLGISEDDYYNKPAWSWARIDFSIKEYKTYDETRKACMAKGEEYFNEGLGYSCTSINSYSGNYLGEMLKTF